MEEYKLPGSSYNQLMKIICAYAATNGTGITLAELAKSADMKEVIISRNNSFLTQAKLLAETGNNSGNKSIKRVPTALCIKLGKAYVMDLKEKVIECWNEVVKGSPFLNKVISVVPVKNDILKKELVNNIIKLSVNSVSNNSRTGATAIIEILKITNFVKEQEGRISIVAQSVEQEEKEILSIESHVSVDADKNDIIEKENHTLEQNEYCVYTYSSNEKGKLAELSVSKSATEDDLLVISHMLNAILKSKKRKQ